MLRTIRYGKVFLGEREEERHRLVVTELAYLIEDLASVYFEAVVEAVVNDGAHGRHYLDVGAFVEDLANLVLEAVRYA